MNTANQLRVLHSFPHRLGKARICTTAWYEIKSTARAGAQLLVLAGDSIRPFEEQIEVKKTLAYGRLRIPSRILGTFKTCILHDWVVSKYLPKLRGEIDIIHVWPLGALETIKSAKKMGIPVVLERCNAHTRFAYEVVRKECERIGVPLPKGHEHKYNKAILEREEKEYEAADALLCPSDFVVKTFIDQGYPKEKLIRYFYGVDEKIFYPSKEKAYPIRSGLRAIFVGVCAVRKGLHYALEAWIKSKASNDGEFIIAGDFIESYRTYLEGMLKHPSVRVLGHRNDIPELMRGCDIFIFPSIEEGFGLVCTEAMASGCVPIVSNACTDLCQHNKDSMVHSVGDVDAIAEHINFLDSQRDELMRLREAGLAKISSISWHAAGRSLAEAYKVALSNFH